MPQIKIESTSSNRVENKWLEIQNGKCKYIIGGIQVDRHPNQNVGNFISGMESVLNLISDRKLPCVIAGDINDTATYVDCLCTIVCQQFSCPLV